MGRVCRTRTCWRRRPTTTRSTGTIKVPYRTQCCGSGMFIPDPDFYPSRISKNSNKREGGKNCCYTFLCSHKFHKIAHYFSFDVLKKKIWANFQRIMVLFTQKIVTKLSKIWLWDPRSGIRKKPIPDPGSKGSKRHRIPDPDPKH